MNIQLTKKDVQEADKIHNYVKAMTEPAEDTFLTILFLLPVAAKIIEHKNSA